MEGLIEGQIVHFVSQREGHRAAIVVDVIKSEEGVADLFVFFNEARNKRLVKYDDGEYQTISNPPDIVKNVPYSEEPKPGTWHWIEKA